MAQYVIGVDGGGTKTLGAIADMQGSVLASTEVGSTNHMSNPMEFVRGNLESLISNLLNAVSAAPSDIDSICLGMAGVDRPEDKSLMEGVVGALLPGVPAIIVNDGIIALMGGALRPVGIVVISGTGSIAFGFDAAGTRARAGGWGHILGDEGSGYSLALRALREICRTHDGRKPSTALTALVLNHLELEAPEKLLGWIKEIQASKSEIATLSRLVTQAAEAGDATAQQIVNEESEELAATAAAVARKLFPGGEPFEIVVAGGTLRKSPLYFNLFATAVARHIPNATVVHPRKEPVEGAVLYALHQRAK